MVNIGQSMHDTTGVSPLLVSAPTLMTVKHQMSNEQKASRGRTGACLEDEVFAHDSKVNLTKAGHALHMAHEGQQVWEQGQEDPEDD